MQKVSNISIFVMYIMYFLAALFGYLTFKGESMFLALFSPTVFEILYVSMKPNNIRCFRFNPNSDLKYFHK